VLFHAALCSACVGFPAVSAAAVLFCMVINSGLLHQSLLRLFSGPAAYFIGIGFLVDNLVLFLGVSMFWFWS